jgi:choline dehydrogenase-like flavoprotein
VPEDRAEAVESLVALSEIFFAAGARTVSLPFANAADAGDMADVRSHFATADWRRALLNAVHPQGTCAIGADPRTAACDPYGGLYGAPGVFVCDASLFPTSVGVPPQVTIMAQASLVAGLAADSAT